VENRLHQLVGELAHFLGDERLRIVSLDAVERRRNRHGLEHGQRLIDAGLVFLDDVVALLLELLLDSGLDVADGFVGRNDVGQLEEAGLHDGRNVLRAADFERQLEGVDGVDLDVLLDDRFLHVAGEAFEDLVGRKLAVDQERAAVNDAGEHVVTADVGRIVAGDEIRRGDRVFAGDRLVAETQVRNGDAAGLLRVVDEVGLHVLVGVVADDLDRVLVRTDGAVAAETPEHARGGAGRLGDNDFVDRQRQVGDVVVDADGEVVRILAVEMLVNRIDHRRGEFLAGETVTAADDGDAAAFEGGLDIEVERLAEAARLLAAGEDGDLLDRLRQRLDQRFGRERTVEADLDQAELLALAVQVADRFFDGFATGTHRKDDLVGIRGSDIVEEVVAAAGGFSDLVHVFLNDARKSVVLLVGGLAALEVDVRILGGHLGIRGVGTQRAVAEALDILHIDHRLHVREVEQLDLLELVRGAEAVEEGEERNFALQRRQVGDEREVVGLLDRRGGSHRVTGGAAAHHVGVIAEDRQRLGRERAGRNMKDRREHLTGDLVHVRDHEEQSLAGCVGGGQRTGRKRTVYRARRTGLGLHFRYFEFLAEHVLEPLARPDVGILAHRRRGSDRVDRRHFAERVSYVRRRVIPVDGLHFLRHDSSISEKLG